MHHDIALSVKQGIIAKNHSIIAARPIRPREARETASEFHSKLMTNKKTRTSHRQIFLF